MDIPNFHKFKPVTVHFDDGSQGTFTPSGGTVTPSLKLRQGGAYKMPDPKAFEREIPGAKAYRLCPPEFQPMPERWHQIIRQLIEADLSTLDHNEAWHIQYSMAQHMDQFMFFLQQAQAIPACNRGAALGYDGINFWFFQTPADGQ